MNIDVYVYMYIDVCEYSYIEVHRYVNIHRLISVFIDMNFMQVAYGYLALTNLRAISYLIDVFR
jgi:hypothetical protein